MPLHFHYCMGELKHVTFLLKVECHGEGTVGDLHACCGVSKSSCSAGHSLNKCCNDSTEWLQDEIPALLQKVDSDTLTDGIEAYPKGGNHVLISSVHSELHPGSNLQISPRPLYLLKCSLIYYG
jgi:hypothetical protein